MRRSQILNPIKRAERCEAKIKIMQEKLPEIKIHDAVFQFDIDSLVFIKKDDPSELIFFNHMYDCLTHYEYYQKIGEKDVTSISRSEADIFDGPEQNEKIYQAYNALLVKVKIPRIAEIDPEGMMRKYACSLDDIKNKTDFEIIVDQDVIKRRMAGETVKIDIGNKVYQIDALRGFLQPLDSSESEIDIAQYRHDYYIEDEDCYYLHCNMENGRIVDPLRDQSIENTIVYKVPCLTSLDPIPVIDSLYFLTDMELYYHQDLKMSHTAEPVYQVIGGNALSRKDFKVERPELETLVFISDHDPGFTLQEYRSCVIADKKVKDEVNEHLTIIYEKNNKPYGARIIVPFSPQSDNPINHGQFGISEAKKHIDIFVDKTKNTSSDACHSKLLHINKYLELYHSSTQIESRKNIPSVKKLLVQDSKQRNGPKI